MNNLEFLEKLNKCVEREGKKPAIDLAVYDVNGTPVGASIHSSGEDAYLINAYVANGDSVKRCGEITITLKNYYDPDIKENNGHIDYLEVYPEFRNKKTSTSKRDKNQNDLHIGSFLLELAEQILVNGAKFNKIYLDRMIYNKDGLEYNRKSLNQNYMFYNKHGYFKDLESKVHWEDLEPYLKKFKENPDVFGFSEITTEEFQKSDYAKIAKYFRKYVYNESAEQTSLNLIIGKDATTPYLITDIALNRLKNRYKAVCHLINEHEQKLEPVASIIYNKNCGDDELDYNKIISCEFVDERTANQVGEQLLKYCEDRLFSFGVRKIGYNPDVIKQVYNGKMPKINNFTTDGVNYYKQNDLATHLVRVCPIKFAAQKK